jgi:hybrid polyketide synthase/nonribosomal peptide synthetase ACE1
VGFFQQASEQFKKYSNQMVFKVLDIEKPPSGQGYEPHSCDIIIASNVLHATASLQRTLENTRQLLKPGGYLILLELTNNGPTRFSNIMGGLPGWWLGVDDGRKYAPTITPGRWHTALRKAGFGGIDAITPEIDQLSWPLSIMVSQAVDDQVNFLRRPLVKSSSSATIHMESLVIMGTGSLESAQIAEELEDRLSGFFRHITILDGLPTEDDTFLVPPMSVFINLVDIASPIFRDMTAEKMESLKRVYDLAKQILWITVGAQGDEPYHMASISFSRAMSHEAGHIFLNHLDMSDLNQDTSRIIAEYLLRQTALDEWQSSSSQKDKLLWSKEPEAFYNHGHLMIPRLISNVDQNDRINSARRAITKAIPTSASNIAILPSSDLTFSLVEQTLPTPIEANESLVGIERSSLMALRVAADTFLFIGFGKDSATKESVLVLSCSNSNEVVPLARVPAQLTQSSEQLLVVVASECVSASLIENIPSGSRMVIHCTNSDRFFIDALSRRAVTKRICLTITTDNESSNGTQELNWMRLSARMPKQTLRQLLQSARATHYLDLTTTVSELSQNISAVLPAQHKRIDLAELFREESLLSGETTKLTSRLEEALESLSDASDVQVQDLVVPLHHVRGYPRPSSTTAVVDWSTSENVTVDVRPLDAQRLFSHDKTYLLIGLSGQIGQSLCDWMIANGAGCVCLTSRNPNVDKNWLKTFEAKNATVKIYSMYVIALLLIVALELCANANPLIKQGYHG